MVGYLSESIAHLGTAKVQGSYYSWIDNPFSGEEGVLVLENDDYFVFENGDYFVLDT